MSLNSIALVFGFLGLIGCTHAPIPSVAIKDKPAPEAQLPAPPVAPPPQDLEAAYRTIARKLDSSMRMCSGRVWPGYDWHNMNIIMINPGKSLSWSAATGELTSIDEATLPPKAFQGIYSFLRDGERRALTLNPIGPRTIFKNEDVLFNLAVHEGFHFTAQHGWKKAKGRRGTSFPLEVQPRMYRRMMFDRMKEHFVSGGHHTHALGQAAFWFQKWRQEYPHEFAAATDGYEGTARYVELIAEILGEEGCDITEERMRDLAIRAVSERATYRLGENVLQLDSEGYFLGSISSLILRFFHRASGWEKRIPQGVTPVEVLLTRVTPIEDAIPSELIGTYQGGANRKNAEMARTLDSDVQHFHSGDMIRISPPVSSHRASYSPMGFYLPQNLPGVVAAPLAQSIQFKGEDWNLTAHKTKVFFSIPNHPCESSWDVTLVPRSSVSISEDRIRVIGSGMNGEMPGILKKDEHGLDWFCGT